MIILIIYTFLSIIKMYLNNVKCVIFYKSEIQLSKLKESKLMPKTFTNCQSISDVEKGYVKVVSDTLNIQYIS